MGRGTSVIAGMIASTSSVCESFVAKFDKGMSRDAVASGEPTGYRRSRVKVS